MTKYVNDNGVSEMWTNTKNYISAQLLGYSQTGHTHSASDITSGLSTVATSGSYSDLDNKPTIPTVNNATLTIQRNGTTVDTFTANASVDKTINISTTDDTKIPLAGSNQISGSLIPSTDGTVNLGSVSYQWNNAYIKSLTINGVACGDILTHNVSEFVPVTGTSALAGSIVPSTDNAYDLGSSSYVFKNIYGLNYKIKEGNLSSIDNSHAVAIYGGTDYSDGGYAIFYGKNSSSNGGYFSINAKDGTNASKLQGTPSGTLSWSGTSIIPASNNTCDLGSSSYGFASFYVNKLYLKGSTIFKLVDDSFICLGGATAQANGANLTLNGKNRSTSTGEFKLEARDGTYTQQLIGKPDGNLTISFKQLNRNDNKGNLTFYGGTGYGNAAALLVRGKDDSSALAGGFSLFTSAPSGGSDRWFTGIPSGTLTWNGQAIQYTSDQRLKQQISQIDDDLLTAWEDVEPVQFKYNDAVKEKSDNARLHTGYVVQQIDEACKSHGVDISQYGLYCHEEYAEETREVEHDDGTKTTEVVRPASEHYSLRYTEALIVECAFLRKKLKELTARIEQLEKGNNTK